MKQLPLDENLRTKIKGVDASVDPDKIAVFLAAALSTAPVRKKHPVFLGAVHSVGFLEQMRASLQKESRPLQIMHGSSDGDQLPIGRVFQGEISPGTGVDGATELLTYFWIDNTHPELIAKVNSGTIDQVSVAILGKEAISNKTGFDFMGPDADFENIWGGVDDKGNKMGADGAHVLVNNLDEWFEMSLVGQGGAQGAKILGGNRLHLSASKQDVPTLTLQLSTGPAPTPPPKPPAPAPQKDTFDMDAKDFAAIVAENATKLANAETAKATAEARATELQTQLTAATTELTTLKASDQAKQVTDLTAERDGLKTQLSAATALPKKLLAPLFTMLGQTTFELDADEAKATEQVKTAADGLKAIGARLSGGLQQLGSAPARQGGNAAFKRRA